MVASRTRTLSICCSSWFWLSAFTMALMPSSLGYQDIEALLAHRPDFSQGYREHLIASPFGTIEPATFSYGVHPLGTAMPAPPTIELINFDSAVDVKPWTFDAPLWPQPRPIAYPTVNRAHKGDRLPLFAPASAPARPANLPQLKPIVAVPAARPLRPHAKSATPAEPAGAQSTHAAAPAPVPASAAKSAAAPHGAPAVGEAGTNRAPALPPGVPASGQIGSPAQASASASPSVSDDGSLDRSAEIYFDSGFVGSASGLEQWAPGAAPVRVATSADSGITLAALDTAGDGGPGGGLEAGKDLSRLQSPAQRLGLIGHARAKAEKCLAEAVYFEARGEPLRGQEAVAQVVMNRVFSGYYPANVCGVVFQNASHYLACQFTFACEHKNLNRIDEPAMWAQAKRIASETLDGKIWLPDIGHATHYHAYWVHPSWVHEMTRLYKLGGHTFYRPRAWGKGNYEPVWGERPDTSRAAPNLRAAKSAQADAAPVPDAGDSKASAKL